MMSESRRCTLLLLNAVAGLLSVSGAGIPLKYVCPGDSVQAFQNIQFNHCNAHVSLNINGDRNEKIATWLIQNCTRNETLLPEYQERVLFDQNGTITIHNFHHFDQAKYVVISKMYPLPKTYEVQLSLMVAPTKDCKPMIERLGNNLIASLEANDCGKPVAIPYWKDYGGISNTNEPILKLPPGKEASTYIACIEGPALTCAKDIHPQNYCSAFITKGSSSPEMTLETGNRTVIILVSIVVGTLFILLIVVTLILITKMRRRRNLNGNHTTPLLEIHQPGTKQLETVSGDHTVPLAEIQLQKIHDNLNSPNDDEQRVLGTRNEQECKTEEAITEHQPSIDTEKMRELQELRDAALCKICFTGKNSVCFMPCKHIATCANCSISLQQCPVCRAIIVEKMNICVD